MNNPIVRNIVAAIIGVVVAGIFVRLGQAAGHLMFPPPTDLDLTKPEDLARMMEVIPVASKIAVVAAWFLGSLAGTYVARQLGRNSWPSWIVAGLMILASFGTTMSFPHPTWMMICAVLLPIAALMIAGRMVPRPKP